MINPELFSAQMAILLDWCQTTLPDPVLATYQATLSATLSDRQFCLAVSKLLVEIPPKPSSLPSVKQILEQVILTSDERGLIEWEKILDFQDCRKSRPIMLEISEQGHRALRLVGGFETLSEASITQISFMRRDFLAYRKQLERVTALRRGDHQSLESGEVKSFTNWDKHPKRQEWITEINDLGVPAFLATGEGSESNQRVSFYRYASERNWLN